MSEGGIKRQRGLQWSLCKTVALVTIVSLLTLLPWLLWLPGESIAKHRTLMSLALLARVEIQILGNQPELLR
jgi:hypothetical protein